MEKLVRDLMPQVCDQDGFTPMNYRLADPSELKSFLLAKLMEEANELRSAGLLKSKSDIVEEIVDVLEVIEAIKDQFGVAEDEVEVRKADKASLRGAFRRGIIWDGKK